MCGICGIIYKDKQKKVSSHKLTQMVATLAHRGPDGSGIEVFGNVGFGHSRLSIIDLSEKGRQPMSNTQKNIHITYNGEIYNHRDIKNKLINRGYQFQSQTDTEVILFAFEEWGIDCLQHLNGMFAFALWDQRNETLHVVRDRLGIKPIFYFVSEQGLHFGSEIKAILADSDVPRRVDFQSLDGFFSLNYMVAPSTLLEDIQQLESGCRLEYKNGQLTIKQYWELDRFNVVEDKGEKYYLQELEERFLCSVKRRMMSDVPVGAFLSGGIDSSMVTYNLNRMTSDSVKTFSIGFEESSFNELPYARQVARLIETNHFESTVRADAAEILPKIVWHSEEPTADSSMIPLYYLCKHAREHVKVVLTGDGADELFAGYETYVASFAASIYRKFPKFLRRNIVDPMIGILPVSDTKISLEQKLKRFVYGAGFCDPVAHFSWRLICSQELKQKLYSSDLKAWIGDQNVAANYISIFEQLQDQTFLKKMLYADIRQYLPNDMLVKVDRMSMMHGLEARVPFLDHELVEFVMSIPDRYKLKRYLQKKYILKKLLKNKLPREIIRRKKAGFNVPVGQWLRGELKNYLGDQLLGGEFIKTGWINRSFLEKMIRDHNSFKIDYSHQLWGLLSLSIWFDKFVSTYNTTV